MIAWLAASALAGRCLDGTEATFGPGLEGCVVGGPPALQIRRNGTVQVFDFPPEPPILEPVGAADLDGDPTLEWVLVQRCQALEGGFEGACPEAKTWIVDPDPSGEGRPVTSWSLPAGEVHVSPGMVLVAQGDRASCSRIHRGELWSCGTFTRSSP